MMMMMIRLLYDSNVVINDDDDHEKRMTIITRIDWHHCIVYNDDEDVIYEWNQSIIRQIETIRFVVVLKFIIYW